MRRARGLRFAIALLVGCAAAAASEAEEALPVHRGIGGDFALTQTDGPPFRLADHRGKAVLLSFGFTHCPDVCPATLSRLASVRALLGKDAAALQVLFVSFDPERDTPEHLRQYLAFFDPSFLGASAPEAELREVAARYRVVFDRAESQEDDDYSFAHTNRFYLIDRNGMVRKLYNPSVDPGEIAGDVRRMLAEKTRESATDERSGGDPS